MAVTLAPDLTAALLAEIRYVEAEHADQGAGYTGRWAHAPVDRYGAPIVPASWPVNPPGRVA